LKKQLKIGLGAFALLLGVAFAATRPQPATQADAVSPTRAHLQLAALSTASRRDIDYAALNARLKRLAEQRPIVGLAVGIVENGRITFLNGYGETLAGSGEKVTPDTVFRWASVSKGLAATMIRAS
jgi:beta-lactamase class C